MTALSSAATSSPRALLAGRPSPRHGAADGPARSARACEGPFGAGRRDVDRALLRVRVEEARDALAERMSTPAGMVDVDAERLGRESSRASTSTPGSVARPAARSPPEAPALSRTCRLPCVSPLTTRMGASRAHFAKPVKCGEPRIAPPGRHLPALRPRASRTIVTGPSLTSSTSILAPKAPSRRGRLGSERVDEAFDERLCVFRRRGVGEARPLPLRVSASSVNWRDDERLAATVQKPAGESALGVAGRSAAGRSSRPGAWPFRTCFRAWHLRGRGARRRTRRRCLRRLGRPRG